MVASVFYVHIHGPGYVQWWPLEGLYINTP